MQGFTQKIVQMMKNEKLFASQGGPIILSQVSDLYIWVGVDFLLLDLVLSSWQPLLKMCLLWFVNLHASRKEIFGAFEIRIEHLWWFYCEAITLHFVLFFILSFLMLIRADWKWVWSREQGSWICWSCIYKLGCKNGCWTEYWSSMGDVQGRWCPGPCG